MFHPRVFFGRGANRFSRSFAAPMGRPSPEVLIYLRVLVMVTVVAEATGREFILDVRHSLSEACLPGTLARLMWTGNLRRRALESNSNVCTHMFNGHGPIDGRGL